MIDIREYLKSKKLLCDGAFGTYYANIGSEKIVELANINDKEGVYNVHRTYVEMGAKLIRTNTFMANSTLGYGRDKLKEIIKSAYDIAKRAAEDNAYVACDIGPSDIKEDYFFAVDTFIEKGGDIFVFETFGDTEDILPVAEYIKSKNKNAFVIFQFCVNQHGFSERGISASRLINNSLESPFVDGAGLNCGIGPGHLYNIIKNINVKSHKYITALPNASYPSVIQDRVVFLDNINYFSTQMEKISEYADIIGGCCGTNPQYIKAIASMDIYSPGRKAVAEKEEVTSEASVENVFFKNRNKGEKIIAVELDPPKTVDCSELMETANFLKNKGVDIITFADSPSGRTRADSMLMSIKVMRETGVNVMPHICCRDRNAISISSALLGAYINGIRNFLVITGDPVPNASRDNVKSVFNFDSVKLMEYIGSMNDESFKGDQVCYGGAINYARRNIELEIQRAIKKQEAGARYFLTQPVFTDEDIEKLKYISSKLSAKVLVGIMPLVSYRNANFIKNEITGINVPDSIIARFSPDMTKEEGRATGIKIAKEIMAKVESFADGYYFVIPFNRLSIAEALLDF